MNTMRVVSTNPTRPTEIVAAADALPAARVEVVVQRARVAQRSWWDAGAGPRSDAMTRFAQRLAENTERLVDLMVAEVGKPLIEARGEMARAVKIADFYAQQTLAPVGYAHPPSLGGLLWHERRPHGVAGIVTPWNFPIAIPLWKALPALAAGNAVVLKPSPDSIGSAQALADLVRDTMPADLFSVVVGGAETGRALVDAVDVVSFTGSEAVGRTVVQAAAARMCPVQTEMGGQNAALVLPDADIESTAAMIAGAGIAFAGQKCTATRRVVVVGDDARHAAFADALTAAVHSLELGDPRDASIKVGPLISARTRDAVLAVPDLVASEGGRVLTTPSPLPDEGWFAAPLVVDGVPFESSLVTEELFGPVVVVQRATDAQAGIALAEGTRFGLVTGIYGRDAGPLLDAARRVGAGMIKINAPTTGVDYYAPFGGEGASSYGAREQGLAALDFYSSTHTITFAS